MKVLPADVAHDADRLAGRHAESDAALAELTETCSGQGAFQIAEAHASRGEADAAFAWLERAHAQHDAGIALMKLDAMLRPLHTDPRWNAFLGAIGLV